ncbi:MAG: DUF6125 family protein [Bacteroidales bacterium]
MTKTEIIKLIIDVSHRLSMHHAFWFVEVQKKFGSEKAFEIMSNVFETSYNIQMKRLSKILDFELEDGTPSILNKMDENKVKKLLEGISVNWLANDGVWFQAVENSYNMTDAKYCNDNCWAQFSPFEARSIMKHLGLPANSGLDGLKKALQYRIYAFVNVQEIVEEKDKSFVFRMNDCRVQSARKRKGLDDYPCKSAGIVEYTTFAETIDSRIKTECIACPPDKHPDEWYCGWRFYI